MRFSYRVLIGAVTLVALATAAAAIGYLAPSAPPKPGANIGTAVDQPLPSWATSIVFTDDTGQHTTLGAFAGKTVVFTPFMTLCQETCPLTTSNLEKVDASVIKAHQQDHVQIVEITIDPGRDTIARLHAYRSVAQITAPNWSLLTAAPADLTRLWKLLGVDVEKTPEGADGDGDDGPAIDWLTGQPLTYDLSHTDELFYLDKTGHERFLIVGKPNTQGVLPAPVLDKFLSDEGRANLTSPDASAWTVGDATIALAWILDKHLPKP